MDQDNQQDLDKIARELARVQKEVTGLSDNEPQANGSPLSHEQIQNPANEQADSEPLNEKLASARKVMELLDKMRPQSRHFRQTVADFETPNTAQETLPSEKLDSLRRPGPDDVPEFIGRFEIQSLLGHGGFSLVFKARDPRLQRWVALKVPTLESMLKPESRARFQLESRAVAALNHPNIVPVLEVGSDGPITFIASAYIEGIDLARWVARHGVLPPRKAAGVVATIADAIEHAHQREIIHRDLKPANILIKLDSTSSEDTQTFAADSILVADFGLAKMLDTDDRALTRTGSVLGTPEFSAPEQLAPPSKEQTSYSDKSADIYSMGGILYFLLTGKPPQQSDNLLDLIQQAQSHVPETPVGAPAELGAICMKALEKSPSNRYASAFDLGRDLQNFLDGNPVNARPVGPWGKFTRWCQRNPIVATLCFVTLGAILMGTAASVWSARNATIASQQAKQQYLDSKRVIDEYYVQVSRDPMYLSSSFRFQKQKLLQAAKKHYVEFLKQNEGDSDLVVDLIRTEVYLANAEMEFGALQTARDNYQDSLAACDLSLSMSEDSDELQILRAMCRRGIGTIDARNGAKEETLAHLEEAAEILESLLPRMDADQSFAFELIQSYQSLGNYHRNQGAYEQANLYSLKQQDLLESLAAKTELNATLQCHFAMSLGDQSMFVRNQGQLEESVELLNQSIEITEKLIENEPNPIWFAEIAAVHLYRRGVVRFRSKDGVSAMSDATRCLELLNSISIHNRTIEFIKQRISARNLLSVCLITSYRPREALELTGKNLEDSRKLAEANPHQPELRQDLAIYMFQQASALTDDMQTTDAMTLMQELISYLDQLDEEGITHPLINSLKIAAPTELGRILHRQEKFSEAIEAFASAMQLANELRESVAQNEYQGIVQSIYENRYFSHLALGQFDEAISDRRKSIEMGPSHSNQQLPLAEALARNGDLDEARQALVDEADSQGSQPSGASREIQLAFVHGAIASELEKRWQADSTDDQAKSESEAEWDLAEVHFLQAVDLGFFKNTPNKYLALKLRNHLQTLFERPAIAPLVRQLRTIWENRD